MNIKWLNERVDIDTWNKIVPFLLITFALIVLATVCFPILVKQQSKNQVEKAIEQIQEPIEKPTSYIYIDHSAKTGFLTSEKYDITFEGFDYPVAFPEGSEPEYDTVYTIMFYRYGCDEGIPHRVDSFADAVGFLEGMR